VRHRANYGPMLSRLSGDQPAPSLKLLADVSEALGLGPRRGGRYTTEQPLNRFVDAARPESETVRALEKVAARFAAAPDINSADAEELRRTFRRWEANDAQFTALADGNGFLTELKPLSKELAGLGAMGLKAMEYLASKSAPSGWSADRAKDLDRIKRPTAEVTLAAYRPVKVLVDALK
jgi:hexosaminidase